MFILQNKCFVLHIIFAAFYCLWFLSSSGSSQLIVNLISTRSEHKESSNPIKEVSYCVSCPDPENEGSVLYALNSRFGLDEYGVTGEVVYCVPNHAEFDMFFNDYQFQDRVVMVNRGKVPLLEKILRIQDSGTGAVGVIIVDDGSCQENFSYCSSKIGSSGEGGFAAYDDPNAWSEVEIPAVLITAASGEKLRALMNIQKSHIPGIGEQYVSAVSDANQRVASLKRRNEL